MNLKKDTSSFTFSKCEFSDTLRLYIYSMVDKFFLTQFVELPDSYIKSCMDNAVRLKNSIITDAFIMAFDSKMVDYISNFEFSIKGKIKDPEYEKLFRQYKEEQMSFNLNYNALISNKVNDKDSLKYIFDLYSIAFNAYFAIKGHFINDENCNLRMRITNNMNINMNSLLHNNAQTIEFQMAAENKNGIINKNSISQKYIEK